MYEQQTGITVLKCFLHEYFTMRSLWATSALCAPNIIAVGTGEGKNVCGIDQLREILRREFEIYPSAIPYEFLQLSEQAMGPVYTCYAQLRLHLNQGRGEEWADTRLTATVFNGKLLQIHLSVPLAAHRSEDVMPFHYRVEHSYKGDLLQQKKLMEIITDLIPGGMVGGYLEEGYPISFINDELLQWLGYTYAQFIQKTGGRLEEIIHPDDKANVHRTTWKLLEAGNVYEVSYRIRKKSGEYLWVFEKGKEFVDDAGRMAFTAVVMDISESMVQKERLEREACYDSLTGIYNRRKGVFEIEYYLQQKKPGTFCIVDVDNFKRVNDLYGHLAGDNVLLELAHILKTHVRQSDIVARIGGDEFILYLYNVKKKGVIQGRIQQICEDFSRYIDAHYPLSMASLSVGAWYSPQQAGSFSELYEKADRLMYSVKRSGKNNVILSGVGEEE